MNFLCNFKCLVMFNISHSCFPSSSGPRFIAAHPSVFVHCVIHFIWFVAFDVAIGVTLNLCPARGSPQFITLSFLYFMCPMLQLERLKNCQSRHKAAVICLAIILGNYDNMSKSKLWTLQPVVFELLSSLLFSLRCHTCTLTSIFIIQRVLKKIKLERYLLN